MYLFIPYRCSILTGMVVALVLNIMKRLVLSLCSYYYLLYDLFVTDMVMYDFFLPFFFFLSLFWVYFSYGLLVY